MNRILFGLLAAALLVAGLFYLTRRSAQAGLALQPDLQVSPPAPADGNEPLARKGDASVGIPASAPAQVTARADLSARPRPGPCRIDGVVLLRANKHDSPIENANVALREVTMPGAAGSNSEDGSPMHAVLARTRSGSGGTFAFEGLSGIAGLGGAGYRIEVRLPSGEERDAVVTFTEVTSAVRVAVVFGGACIRGVLHGFDEKPLALVRVTLDFPSDDPALRSSDWGTTDPEGKYRFDDLPAGQCLMHFGFRLAAAAGGVIREYSMHLTDCDDLILDLGGDAGYARFHGNLVAPAGEQLGTGAFILLSRSNRTAAGIDVSMRLNNYFGVQDGFDFPLEPASWKVQVSSGGHEWYLSEPLLIEGREIARDITLPPTSRK